MVEEATYHLLVPFSQSVTNANTVVLSVTSTVAVTDAEVSYGTLNGVGTIRAACDAAYQQGKNVYVPRGHYFVEDGNHGCNIELRENVILFGDGDNSILEKDPRSTAGYMIQNNTNALQEPDFEKRNFTVRNLRVRGATGLYSNLGQMTMMVVCFSAGSQTVQETI
jgi:hypothetical protein